MSKYKSIVCGEKTYMSLPGIGWYAKVNELMIISEDPKV